jgi:hypothetical protein
MPRIPMPQRSQLPPSGVGAERMPAWPMPSRRIGSEMERLGMTLRSIGGDFADLAERMRRSQIREELNQGKQNAITEWSQFLPELEKDPDLFGRSKRAKEKWGKIVGEQSRMMKTEQAKADYAGWSEINLFTNMRAEAEQYVKAGKLDEYNELMDARVKDGVTSGERADTMLLYARGLDEDFRYKQLKTDALNQALLLLEGAEEVEAQGLEAAIAWLTNRENVPGLKLEDRETLIRQIEARAKRIEIENLEFTGQRDEKVVAELCELMAGGNLEYDRIEVMDEGVYKNRWHKIWQGWYTKKEPMTKWKEFIDLEEKLFDYWDRKITKRELKTQIAEARAMKRSISNEQFNELLRRADLDLSQGQMINLRQGFETIRRKQAGLIITTEKDAQTIGEARMALLKWSENPDNKKKVEDVGEVYEKALTLSTVVTPKGAGPYAGMGTFIPAAPGKAPVLPNPEWYQRNPDKVEMGIKAYEDAGMEAPDWLKALRDRIKIRLPDGRIGTIPRSNLDEALEKGAEIID